MNIMIINITKSEKETFDLGLKLAKKLKGGQVLALCGDLGAGKTKFLQGLAKGLGVRAKVNSPTFNILKLYKVYQNSNIEFFCHIDAYRLSSGKDLLCLGVEECFQNKKMVTAIEWAEKVKNILPNKTIVIKIKSLSEGERKIVVK